MKVLRATWLVPVLLACASGSWNDEALRELHPKLAAIEGHRLPDSTPYLFPYKDEVALFLCRWGRRAVPVSLPPDATPDETRLLESALEAWRNTGVGVRFQIGGAFSPPRGIEIRFSEEAAGSTEADCEVEPAMGAALPATLVYASVRLPRLANASEAEFAGAALHQLGHALGFQGHARGGDTVMVQDEGARRAAGERLLAGEPFEDATLRALYVVPSGVVVGRSSLPAARTEHSDRLVQIGRERGWRGPFARVSDEQARLVWYRRNRREVSMKITGLPGALREPTTLQLVPSATARQLLGIRPR